MVKVGINGFGRIGRLILRALLENYKGKIQIVGINDLGSIEANAHLIKYDSTHGTLNHKVKTSADGFQIGDQNIKVFAEKDPAKLPWGKLGAEVVLECTGFFLDKVTAGKHIEAGAKKVLISAPASGSGVKTIVLGVNDHEITENDTIISNASCTTNCLAPVCKVLDESFGFVKGSLTTTHAYTADQRIQDAPHSDLRRARAAAYNIIPTSTGAANAVGLVYPNVLNKMFAIAVRVPVITGSMIELNVILDKEVSKEEINAAFEAAANGPMKGILQYSTDPLVSSDIVRNQHSSVFDSLLTDTMGTMVKVVSWYDNEAGFSARFTDLVTKVS